MNKPAVYILQSLKNYRYYIGSTDSLERRIKQHNNGLVKATKFIIPMEIRAFINCETISEARRAEYRLKKYKSKNVLEKVIKDGIFPWEYNK